MGNLSVIGIIFPEFWKTQSFGVENGLVCVKNNHERNEIVFLLFLFVFIAIIYSFLFIFIFLLICISKLFSFLFLCLFLF